MKKTFVIKARTYRSRLTGRRFYAWAFRTKKDRGRNAVSYGVWTLRPVLGGEDVEVTGAELRRSYEWLREAS